MLSIPVKEPRMLNDNAVAIERLENFQNRQKSIEVRMQHITELEKLGSTFTVNSTQYFRYNVKVVFATGLSIFLLAILVGSQVSLSSALVAKLWGISPSVLAGLAVVIFLCVLFYSQRQKSDLQKLHHLNVKCVGWFENSISQMKLEVEQLLDEYDQLISNENYISVLDDEAIETARNFIMKYKV